MNRIFRPLLALGLALALFACNDKQPAPLAGSAPAAASSQNNYLTLSHVSETDPDPSGLSKFNKTLYPSIDSIVFSGQVHVRTAAAYGVAELVNVWENQILATVPFDASRTGYISIEPVEVTDRLPARQITLAVRIRTDQGYVYLAGSQFYLQFSQPTSPARAAGQQ